MARHVNEHNADKKTMVTFSSMLLVNEFSAQLDRTLGKCRRDSIILIEAIINAQKGILQPHVYLSLYDSTALR
jgi:hypothetical protein